jgi:hypothetical protein
MSGSRDGSLAMVCLAQELLDWTEEQFGTEADMISFGPATLYSALMAAMPIGAASFKRRAAMT